MLVKVSGKGVSFSGKGFVKGWPRPSQSMTPRDSGKGIRWALNGRVCNTTRKTSLTHLNHRGSRETARGIIFDEGKRAGREEGKKEVRNKRREGGEEHSDPCFLVHIKASWLPCMRPPPPASPALRLA